MLHRAVNLSKAHYLLSVTSFNILHSVSIFLYNFGHILPLHQEVPSDKEISLWRNNVFCGWKL